MKKILDFLLLPALVIAVYVFAYRYYPSEKSSMTGNIAADGEQTVVTSTNNCGDEASEWKEVKNIKFTSFAITATSGQAKKQGNPPQWVAFTKPAQRAGLWISLDGAKCVRFIGITERVPEVWFYESPFGSNSNQILNPSEDVIQPRDSVGITVPTGTKVMNVSAPEGGQTRITRIEVWP